MKQNVLSKIPWYTLLIGAVALMISMIIPVQSLEFLLGALRPPGFVTLCLHPFLGLVGVFFSILYRKWLPFFLNFLMIFSFFVLMFVGYAIAGFFS